MPGLGAAARSYLLTLLATVGQVSARTALKFGPLSSRLCFCPAGLAPLPMTVTLAERTVQAPGCKPWKTPGKGEEQLVFCTLREGFGGVFPSCLRGSSPAQQTPPLPHQSTA